MNLSEIGPAPGSRKNPKRKGRGPGSGNGKTAGRGSKGQKSRHGYSSRRGFEGGQMPLVRRVPKRGFTNLFRKEFVPVNLDRLTEFGPNAEVTPELLVQRGIVKKMLDGIKILGRGNLDRRFLKDRFTGEPQWVHSLLLPVRPCWLPGLFCF